jgi:hypothetical protein
MEKQIEKMSKNIKELWPGAQISIIQGTRDKVGPVLSVRNKSADGLEKLGRSPDFVVVGISQADNAHHVLIIPISVSGIQPYAAV